MNSNLWMTTETRENTGFKEVKIPAPERMQERSIRPRQSHGGSGGGGGGRRKGTIFHPTLGYPIQPPMPVTVQRR